MQWLQVSDHVMSRAMLTPRDKQAIELILTKHPALIRRKVRMYGWAVVAGIPAFLVLLVTLPIVHSLQWLPCVILAGIAFFTSLLAGYTQQRLFLLIHLLEKKKETDE